MGTSVDDIQNMTCTDNTSREEMEMFVFVNWCLEGILQVCISVAGLIANSISIPVLLSKEITNRFNRTLAVLAGFDVVYNLLDILDSIRKHHYEYYTHDNCGPKPYHMSLHDNIYYPILYPLQAIVMMASIYVTVIVAFERYVAVSRPISAFMQDGTGRWKKVCAYILPMLALTILFNLPKFFEFCSSEVEIQCQYSENITPPQQCPYNETATSNSTHPLDNVEEASSILHCYTQPQYVYGALNVNGTVHKDNIYPRELRNKS